MNTKYTLLAALGILVTVEVATSAVGGGLTVNLPNTFTAGTPARASEVNANFDAIATELENFAFDVEMQLSSVAADENILYVATAGTQFDSVADALNSITNASATNRYLVQVGPGVFDELDLVEVPAFVTLAGAGPAATLVRGNRTANAQNSDSTVVLLEDEGALRDIAIENTGSSAISNAIIGNALSDATLISNVHAICTGNGGVGHAALRITDSDVLIERCHFVASGASTSNAAMTSTDSAGPFAQWTLRSSILEGFNPANGTGIFCSNTAGQIVDSTVHGDSRAINASQNGTSRVRGSRMSTLGLNAIYEQSGSAAVLSANSVLIGGDALGLSSQFKYVHCAKANFDPIVNGFGSSID